MAAASQSEPNGPTYAAAPQSDPWDLNDILPEEEDTDTPKWKKYAKIILPHVGLIVLSCLYIVVGAVIFYYLERPYEIKVRERSLTKIGEQRKDFLLSMWNLVNDDKQNKELWQDEALLHMDNLTRMLFEAFDTHYVSANHMNLNSNATDDAWTLMTAVFFTSTLLTTIGYGNLVPVTFNGRMFCICYGLFGVPLILITVADIGKFLSENIVYLYCYYVELKRLIRRRCCQRQMPTADSELSALGGDDDAAMKEELEKFGLEDYISIPVTLILIILIGYIALGAWLLGSWEEWDFFDGFYFSFITMTTVGFGDIVPVKQSYFLLDLLYIIIGLAITTMCIDLVGIQYIRKIHYFGRAIKDARYALINVGGRMVHVGDLMKYASVLQRKYGLKANQGHVFENPFDRFPGAFKPRELRQLRFIDYPPSSDSIYSSHLRQTTSCDLRKLSRTAIPEESV